MKIIQLNAMKMRIGFLETYDRAIYTYTIYNLTFSCNIVARSRTNIFVF